MAKPEPEDVVRLFPAIRKIQDEDIRRKVILAWIHAWEKSNFKSLEEVHQFEPAREHIQYNNVDHTNQVCLVSEKMAAAMEEILDISIRMDYLLAGAILHDIDKLVLFDAQTGKVKSSVKKFNHAQAGGILAREEGLPEEVAHIISSHSATYSPGPPKTVEALIVRYADLLVGNGVYLLKGLEMEKVLRESLAAR